jgi:hypothetical protein
MRKRVGRDAMEALSEADPAAGETGDAGRREHTRARAVALGAGGSGNSPRPRRRLPVLALVAGATAVCAGVLALILSGGVSPAPAPEEAFAQSAVEVADGNPRLLIDDPAWEISYVGEFEPDNGYLDYKQEGDDGRLSIGWQAAEYYSDALADGDFEEGQWYRGEIGCVLTSETEKQKGVIAVSGDDYVECRTYDRTERIEFLGSEATLHESRMVEPDGNTSTHFTVNAPPSGDVYVQIDAIGFDLDREGFLAVLDSIEAVDVETWLGALPDNVVRPLERPEVVDEMLEGIPVPDSVDVEALRTEFAALRRYNLGAAVSGEVACAWLDQWVAATGEDPDSAAAKEAEEALATSREWPILEEMAPQGGWSQVIWEYSENVERGQRGELTDSSGTETMPDGSVYELGPSYATGLGCDSEERTLREVIEDEPKPARWLENKEVDSPEADLREDPL